MDFGRIILSIFWFSAASHAAFNLSELPEAIRRKIPEGNVTNLHIVQIGDRTGSFYDLDEAFRVDNAMFSQHFDIGGTSNVIFLDRENIFKEEQLHKWVAQFRLTTFPTTLLFDENFNLFAKFSSLEAWNDADRNLEKFRDKIKNLSAAHSTYKKAKVANKVVSEYTFFSDHKPRGAVVLELLPQSSSVSRRVSNLLRNVTDLDIRTIAFDASSMDDSTKLLFDHAKQQSHLHTFVLLAKDGSLLGKLNPIQYLQQTRSNNNNSWGSYREDDIEDLARETKSRIIQGESLYRTRYCGAVLGRL